MSVTKEDTERAISILKGILSDLGDPSDPAHQQDNEESSSHAHPALEHLLNVQFVLDKLESPLFSSLLEIQAQHQQALSDPPAASSTPSPRPPSTALSLAENPDLLPQFCRRYGIADSATTTPPSKSLSSQSKKSSRSRSVGSRGRSANVVSDSGRVMPLPPTPNRFSTLGKRSTLLDLARGEGGGGGKGGGGGVGLGRSRDQQELRELGGRGTVRKESLESRSVESSFTSESPAAVSVSSETPSHSQAPLLPDSAHKSSAQKKPSDSPPVRTTPTTTATNHAQNSHKKKQGRARADKKEVGVVTYELTVIKNDNAEGSNAVKGSSGPACEVDGGEDIVTNGDTQGLENVTVFSDDSLGPAQEEEEVDGRDVLIITNRNSQSESAQDTTDGPAGAATEDNTLTITNSSALHPEDSPDTLETSSDQVSTVAAAAATGGGTVPGESEEDPLVIRNSNTHHPESTQDVSTESNAGGASSREEEEVLIVVNTDAQAHPMPEEGDDLSEVGKVKEEGEGEEVVSGFQLGHREARERDVDDFREMEPARTFWENSGDESDSLSGNEGAGLVGGAAEPERRCDYLMEEPVREKGVWLGRVVGERSMLTGEFDNGDQEEEEEEEEGGAVVGEGRGVGVAWEEEGVVGGWSGGSASEEGEGEEGTEGEGEGEREEEEEGGSMEGEAEGGGGLEGGGEGRREVRDDVELLELEGEEVDAEFAGERAEDSDRGKSWGLGGGGGGGGGEEGLEYEGDSELDEELNRRSLEEEVQEVLAREREGEELSEGEGEEGEGEEEEEGGRSSAAATGPRDVLFFMRDKKSQTELSKLFGDRKPRQVSLVLTEGKMGGASKAGLQLGGFSSTGVFVEGLASGSQAEVEGRVQKGDQILQINETEIKNMAAFEVDHLLREAGMGEEVTLQLLYNPTGFAEYQRQQSRERR